MISWHDEEFSESPEKLISNVSHRVKLDVQNAVYDDQIYNLERKKEVCIYECDGEICVKEREI